MTPAERRRVLLEAVVAALAVAGLHLLLRFSTGLLFGVFDDDGVYVTLGKAIAQGSGYHSIHLVGSPVQVKYPPGLPLLLAIPWKLGGSLGAVRSWVSVLQPSVVAAAAAAIWWIGRRYLAIGAWPLVICALTPLLLDPAIQFYNMPLSEPYLVLGWALTLCALLPLVEEREGDATPAGRRLGRAAAVGLVIAGTTLFRTAGLALLPGALAALLLRRRWTEAAVCAVAALVPLVAWAALKAAWIAKGPISASPDDQGYWEWLGVHGLSGAAVHAVAFTAAFNAIAYLRELGVWLLPDWWPGVVLLCVAILSATAVAVLRWRRVAPVVLTVVPSLGMVLAWPYTQERLLLPIFPFAGLVVGCAVDVAVRRSSRRIGLALSAVLGIVAVAVTLRQAHLRQTAARAFEAGVPPRPGDRSPTAFLVFRSLMIAQLTTWVRENATPGDRIMVQAASGVYLYTGRQTEAAIPAESPLVPSVYAIPGRYLSQRILADSLTLLIETPVTWGLNRDIATVQAHCPQVLTRVPAAVEQPVYYRVHRDVDCLRPLAGDLPR